MRHSKVFLKDTTSEAIVEELVEFGSASLTLGRRGPGDDYDIFLVAVTRTGPAEMLLAGRCGASIVVQPETPFNQFELMKGNFPIDIAEQLVVLLASLQKGSDSKPTLEHESSECEAK